MRLSDDAGMQPPSRPPLRRHRLRQHRLSVIATTFLWAVSATAFAQAGTRSSSTEATAADGLRSNAALLRLDYQTVKVPGDQALDLMGLHAYAQVLDGLYLGGGFYAPLLKGGYGGFVAADLGLHLRHRLTGSLFATAGLSAGGGGGGRSVEHSKLLSGSGGFARAHLGLAYELGDVSLGAQLSRLKFRHSLINGTQIGAFLEIPFSYLSGRHADHGKPLSAADEGLATTRMSETLLTLSLDHYRQIDPQGTNKGTVGLADLQLSHFFASDSYWFASLGMGYRGLPLYNQLLGGIGQRLRLDGGLTLYGQLCLGSGGYAPSMIDTGPGLLLYPRLMAEFSLSRDLGLAFSLGYMAAPRGSSRNTSYGIALTRRFGSRPSGEVGTPARYQGLRFSAFQQTAYRLSYQGVERPRLQMVALQLDLPLSTRWYVPLQAAGAYSAYLGYPGYAEILGGLGLQTRALAGERWQAYGQLMAGANVHGRTLKTSLGLRYTVDEQLALNLGIGRTRARSAGGSPFSSSTVALGLDYRFSVPSR